MARLATGQPNKSSQQGIRVVAPGESTRGVKYKEQGGMWSSKMAAMWG